MKIKRAQWIAISLCLVIASWVGIGMAFKSPVKEAKEDVESDSVSTAPFTVEVLHQTAVPVIGYISIQGNVMPNREVVVQAETSGKVKDIISPEGKRVRSGSLLSTLVMEDRKIRLEKAKAQTNLEQQKYNSLSNLGDKGYAPQTRIDEAFAAYKSAVADQEAILLEIEHTRIKAPFDGIIDEQNIEQGDYINVGDDLFTIVDNHPLVVSVQVPQQDIQSVQLGGQAEVTMASGTKVTGSIRFIAPRAQQETRTFRVEVEIKNLNKLPSGTSATVRIPKEEVMAHFVSPALLALDTNGATGIKVIDESGKVAFHPITIISGERDGVYVTGLPRSSRIIKNGQGFVKVGQQVHYEENTSEYLSKK